MEETDSKLLPPASKRQKQQSVMRFFVRISNSSLRGDHLQFRIVDNYDYDDYDDGYEDDGDYNEEETKRISHSTLNGCHPTSFTSTLPKQNSS